MSPDRKEAYAAAYRIVAMHSNMEPEDAGPLIDAIASEIVSRVPAPDVVEALKAAIRAANLALFVIRKQGVMPNSSWAAGFDKDMAKAEAVLTALSTSGREAGEREVAIIADLIARAKAKWGGTRGLNLTPAEIIENVALAPTATEEK